jgi:hypothetical protein
MLTLEQIKETLKPYNLRAVAKETSIEYNVLWRAIRKDKPVKYEVVKQLSDYLMQN